MAVAVLVLEVGVCDWIALVLDKSARLGQTSSTV